MFIVIAHCLSVFDWSASPILEMVLKRIVANGTIFFLFIGGLLFEHLAVEYRPLPYLITKFKFVVVPYIVTSIPALLVFTVFSKRDGMSSGFYLQPIWLQVSEFLLTGTHLAPFWFIPTIIVFYLASPLIYMSFRRRSAYLVLPFLFLIPIFVPRGDADPLQSFVHFLPIWVLGMACSRFSEIASRALMRWFWWLLAAALALLLAEMALTEGTHSWYSDLGKAVFALFLLEGMRRLGSQGNKFFALAGTLSFGIFFMHSYIISAMKVGAAKLFGHPPSGTLIGVFVVSTVAVALTIALVKGLRRLFGVRRSRILIGV